MSGLTSTLSRSLPLTWTTMVTVSSPSELRIEGGPALQVDRGLPGVALLPDLRRDVRRQGGQEREEGVGRLGPHRLRAARRSLRA